MRFDEASDEPWGAIPAHAWPLVTRLIELALAAKPQRGELGCASQEVSLSGARAVKVSATDMDDRALWDGFTACSLTPAEWTHESHLRIAFMFSRQFALDEAHLRMRAGIIRLNERHGLVETGARGYFETLTRAWLILVADARVRSGATSSGEMLERCPELLDRALPLRHYSKAVLSSTRARSIWLAPDLAPLPDVP